MAVLATDDFNRGDSASLGANWTTDGQSNVNKISSNTAVPTSLGGVSDTGSTYSAISWGNDHYSKVQISATGGAANDENGPGPAVRMSGSAGTRKFYRIAAQKAATNNVEVSKYNGTTFTVISNFTNSWSSGDTWEIDIQGTTLTWIKNGSTISSTTDSLLSSGSSGITYSSCAGISAAAFDNWEGGDFSASGLPPGLGPAEDMSTSDMAGQSAMMR
jgi:hypothetical protein